MRLLQLLLVFGFLSLSSCYSDVTVTCADEPADILLTGFDSSDMRNITMNTYVGNGRFDSLIGPMRFDYFTLAQLPRLSRVIYTDTVDYELVLPAIGRSYRISELTRQETHQETMRTVGKRQPLCSNKFLSCTLNGTPRQWPVREGQELEIIK